MPRGTRSGLLPLGKMSDQATETFLAGDSTQLSRLKVDIFSNTGPFGILARELQNSSADVDPKQPLLECWQPLLVSIGSSLLP